MAAVTQMLPTKFRVNWPFGSGEDAKNRFLGGRHGGHLEFLIGTILSIFDLQVSPMLPTKFQANWSFGSGGEAKINFQDGLYGGHFGFSIGTIFAIFDL